MTLHNRLGSRAALKLVLPALPIAVLLAGVALPSAVARPASKAAKTAAPATTFVHEVSPLTEKYCISCHSADTHSGDIVLEGLTKSDTLLLRRSIWEKVSANVASRHMPPAGMPQPTDAERDRLTNYIDTTLSNADCKLNDPGRVTMRRLNRAEYNNSVRDLTGLDLHLADDFPSDDVGYGFDNIGDVLSLSPLLMEKYLGAAGKVARALIKAPEDSMGGETWDGAKLATSGGFDTPLSEGRILLSPGGLEVPYNFPIPARYILHVRAWQQKAGPDAAEVMIKIDGQDVKAFPIEPISSKTAKTVEVTTFVPAGKHTIGAFFTNDYYNTDNPDVSMRGDRNLIIEGMDVSGPQDVPKSALSRLAQGTSAEQARLFGPGDGVKNETERARRILASFARRAYRRPPTTEEVGHLLAVYAIARKNNDSFERGIQLGVQVTLASPNFLFRAERETGKTRELTDYELASRLSYFLWSSIPDETLLRLAEQGKLHDPNVLVAQADRMLKDPKAIALTDNFAGQWLQLRKLDRVTPDQKQFPEWDESLRTAMREETRRYFTTVVHEDRSVLEFLDSDWTFLNGRLARHYGNTLITGDAFQRVKLTGGHRGGLLTQASILTLTSNPGRTSPVKRGRWVLDNLLNTPPPPPPPGVAQLPDDKHDNAPLTGTLRQRLEKHRSNPVCASCHSRMDPIGFGLENFNAIGEWRKTDGDAPIDATGTLPDGKSFDGPKELRTILMQKKDLFTRAITEKLLTYAIGRGVESTDRCNVKEMANTIAAKDYRFSALVEQIVLSQPFRKRRGMAESAAQGVASTDSGIQASGKGPLQHTRVSTEGEP